MREIMEKLREKYKKAQAEMNDMRKEGQGEKEELLDVIRAQEKIVKFSNKVIGIMLTDNELYKLNEKAKWDEEKEDYGFGLDTAQEEFGYGVEWNYLRSLYVRFGYKSAAYGDIRDSTFGFGVDMDRWTGQAIIFDFASVPQARGLPKVSRLSFGYRF